MKLPIKANDNRIPFDYETYGSKATVLDSSIIAILEYCDSNNSTFEYPLVLKLCEFDIGNVSFATDQMERHLEVGSINYESYDSLNKRHLLMSLELFLFIYYKESMLGEQPVSFFCDSVLTEGQLGGLSYTLNAQSLRTTRKTMGLL
ncbi:hypothetical protein Adt_02457 [Abeliophyllum distichum]|uniref:Uncharacterized protein n=1 Tax=Abeliophyllum distichum TaxID=126358 RepID=A0ABD1VVQ9_9LAMI